MARERRLGAALSLLLVAVAVAPACRRSGEAATAMRVVFSSPAEGARVPRVAAVAADVIGGRDPVTVTFSAGVATPVQVSAPPFLANLDLSAVDAAAPLALEVVAVDAGGQFSRARRQVMIDPSLLAGNALPQVALVTPPRTSAPLCGQVEVLAQGSDDGSLASLTLYLDGLAVAGAASSPLRWPWDTTAWPDGGHTLKVVARDDAGQIASDTVPVTVGNGRGICDRMPSVTITTPLPGSAVAGLVGVVATAMDDVSVVKVAFWAGDVPLGTDERPPFEATWDSRRSADGPRALEAVATDSAGLTGRHRVEIIADNTPPTVAFRSPADGDRIGGMTTVTLEAMDVGGLATVSLSAHAADGTQRDLGTRATPPWTFGWDTRPVAGGPYRLAATARDRAGNAAATMIGVLLGGDRGTICAGDAECTSGFCSDGVCCQARCDAPCWSCRSPGLVGQCTMLAGGDNPPRCTGGRVCNAGGECTAVPAGPTYGGTVDLPTSMTAVAAAPGGRVVVVGAFWAATDFDPGPGVTTLTPAQGDAYVAVYGPDLTLEWVRAIGGAGIQHGPAGAGVTPDGGVVVAGLFTGDIDLDPGPGVVAASKGGSSTDYAIYWVKLSARGDHVWSRLLTPPQSAFMDHLVMGADGTSAIGGYARASITFSGESIAPATFATPGERNDFIAAADAGGTLRFLTMADHRAILSPRPAVASDGSVVYGGRFQESLDAQPGPGVTTLVNRGVADGFLTRLDREGKFLWARQIGGPGFESDPAPFISPDGQLYASGAFAADIVFDPSDPQRPQPAGSYATYVMKLGLDNTYQWTRVLSTPGHSGVTWISFFPDGSPLFSGYFTGTLDLDPGADRAPVIKSSAAMFDLFVTRWSTDGRFGWGLAFGAQADRPDARAVRRDDGVIVVGGTGAGAADFDPGPAVDTHAAPAFLTRLR